MTLKDLFKKKSGNCKSCAKNCKNCDYNTLFTEQEIKLFKVLLSRKAKEIPAYTKLYKKIKLYETIQEKRTKSFKEWAIWINRLKYL